MKLERLPIIIILLLFILSGAMCSGPDPERATTLKLNISSNEKQAFYGQPIIIFFNVTNLVKDAPARNINIYTNLSDFFERPLEKLKIDNNKRKQTSKDNNRLYIESYFDNDNNSFNDYACIDNQGRVQIYIGTLDGGKSVSVNFSTFIFKNNCNKHLNISSKMIYDDFQWEPKLLWNQPEIDYINIKMKKEIPKEFIVSIDPEYNRTCYSGANCTLFKNTKLIFTNDLISNEMDNIIFKDIIDHYNEKVIINAGNVYEARKIGTHKFLAEINESCINAIMYNGTFFRVIDIVDYHKELVFTSYFWGCIFLSLLIPSIIILLIRMFKKCKSKNVIYLIIFLIALVYIVCLLSYFLNISYYQDVVKIESITLSIAFIVLIYYHLCINRPYVFSWNEIPGNDTVILIEVLRREFGIDWAKNAKIEKIDNGKTIKVFTETSSLSLKLNDKNNEVTLEIGDVRTNKFITKVENGKLNIYNRPPKYIILIPTIILMMLFVVTFHYYLPEIILIKQPYSFIARLILILILPLIVVIKKRNSDGSFLCDNKTFVYIASVCLIFIIIILLFFLSIMDSGTAFSPRLGLPVMLIIIIEELIPLSVFAIVGMDYDMAKDYIEQLIGQEKS
jgi:hypothetical protein